MSLGGSYVYVGYANMFDFVEIDFCDLEFGFLCVLVLVGMCSGF